MISEILIGEIRLFAGNFAPRNWAFCDGQTLPISSNAALYSILGTQYGGNGRDNFQLPKLASLKEADGGETPIRYVICLQGAYPVRDDSWTEQAIGEIRLFAGNYPPGGWAFCDGQTLPINQNQALYSILGTRYGGNGTTDFQLPKLAPLKESDGGSTPIKYIVALQGIYPMRP